MRILGANRPSDLCALVLRTIRSSVPRADTSACSRSVRFYSRTSCPSSKIEVKSKAVLFWVNDLAEFILQLPALRRVQQAFEHRILHALTVIDTFLCDSAQPPASGGVARVHIVGDQNQHRCLTSIKTADSRPSRRAGTARAAGFVHTVPDPTVSFPRETDA